LNKTKKVCSYNSSNVFSLIILVIMQSFKLNAHSPILCSFEMLRQRKRRHKKTKRNIMHFFIFVTYKNRFMIMWDVKL